jgi:hypothetical protein
MRQYDYLSWPEVSERTQRLRECERRILESLREWVQARGMPQEERLLAAWGAYEAELEAWRLGPSPDV